MTAALAIWELVKRYWFAPVILALFIALLFTRASLISEKLRTAAVQSAYDKTVADYRTKAAERTAADLTNITRVKDETDGNDTTSAGDYEARIADLRRDFAERVRNGTAGSDSSGSADPHLSGISAAASGTDATACQTTLLSKDALVASELAEQLIALQAWNRRQAAVDVNGE